MIVTSTSIAGIAITLELCLRTTTPPLECAWREADAFAQRLGIHRPIVLSVVTERPSRNALSTEWAWARRTKSGIGCQLDFMPDAIRDLETIAHEVCHCRYHFGAMTVSGAVARGVTAKRRIEIEAEATSCAADLVKGVR